MFIAIDGNGGSGKSTVMEKLKNVLNKKEVVFTREPGGTPFGKELRELILNRPELGHRSPLVEFLMFMADRMFHVEELIKPALADGMIVLTDRFIDSTYCYQFVGSGLAEDTYHKIVEATLGDFRPDMTIMVLCDPKISVKRLESRAADRFEQEKIVFHYKVYDAMTAISRRSPERYRIVDGSKTEEEVFKDVFDIYMSAIKK